MHASLLFNAYAHRPGEAHEGWRQGQQYAAADLRIKWFDYLSSGESYHARHHKSPRLAQNSPFAREDWVYGIIWCMERAGLVWKVLQPPQLRQGHD